MPAASEPRAGSSAAAHLAPAGRAARRLVLRRRCCWSCARSPWFGFDAEVRARVHARSSGSRCSCFGLLGRRAGATPWCARGSMARAEQAGRGQRLPPPRARVGRRCVAVHLPPGAPWATLDLADGTTVSAMAHPGLRRRPGRAIARARSCGPLTRPRGPPRPSSARQRPARGCPRRPRARRPARPAGASVDQVVAGAERVRRGGHRLDRERAPGASRPCRRR